MTIAAVLVATLIVLGMLLVLMAIIVRKRRKEGKSAEPNYRVFFMMGLGMFPVGVVLMILWALLDIGFFVGMPFLAMGVAYLAIGLANRDKWQSNR